MRTKAVYVAVSGEADVYFEQAWVSAWSLKHYNPEMEVECVVDPDTYDQVMGCYRRQALSVIDRLVRIEVPAQYGKKERSRWLKTSLRRHVSGDFLFIDTDTVICDSLEEVDSLLGDVLMVKDNHCLLTESFERKYIARDLTAMTGRRFEEDVYYNSGVIFSRDNSAGSMFFEKWHENWKKYLAIGVSNDQPSLAVTNRDLPTILDLGDVYNCQIRSSLRFFYKAKILHFFNSSQTLNLPHPFYTDEVYRFMKQAQGLNEVTQEMVLECKSQFYLDTFVLGGEERAMRDEYPAILLRELKEHHARSYKMLCSVSRFIFCFLQLFKHK